MHAAKTVRTPKVGAAAPRVREGRSSARDGHSIAEVVVALLLLELGVLSVVTSTVLADRISRQALLLERAVGVAEEVADSLLIDGYSGAGSRELPWGAIRWETSEGGRVAVAVMPGGPAGGEPADSMAILTVLLAPRGPEGGP